MAFLNIFGCDFETVFCYGVEEESFEEIITMPCFVILRDNGPEGMEPDGIIEVSLYLLQEFTFKKTKTKQPYSTVKSPSFACP